MFEDEEDEKPVIEDIGGQRLVRNEKKRLVYSYSLFHVMLCLASLFMMMSLTGECAYLCS